MSEIRSETQVLPETETDVSNSTLMQEEEKERIGSPKCAVQDLILPIQKLEHVISTPGTSEILSSAATFEGLSARKSRPSPQDIYRALDTVEQIKARHSCGGSAILSDVPTTMIFTPQDLQSQPSSSDTPVQSAAAAVNPPSYEEASQLPPTPSPPCLSTSGRLSDPEELPPTRRFNQPHWEH